MRPVRPLDPLIAQLREPQRTAIPGPGHIRGLARLQATRRGPLPKHLHRGRDLPQARDHDRLQIRDPSLAPFIHPARLKPVEADQHVDRGHELPLRERGLSGLHHPPIELAARTIGHDPARYTPRGQRNPARDPVFVARANAASQSAITRTMLEDVRGLLTDLDARRGDHRGARIGVPPPTYSATPAAKCQTAPRSPNPPRAPRAGPRLRRRGRRRRRRRSPLTQRCRTPTTQPNLGMPNSGDAQQPGRSPGAHEHRRVARELLLLQEAALARY